MRLWHLHVTKSRREALIRRAAEVHGLSAAAIPRVSHQPTPATVVVFHYRQMLLFRCRCLLDKGEILPYIQVHVPVWSEVDAGSSGQSPDMSQTIRGLQSVHIQIVVTWICGHSQLQQVQIADELGAIFSHILILTATTKMAIYSKFT